METDVRRGRPRTQPLTGTPRSQPRRRRPVVAALRELALVAILYLAYSASRVLADDDLTAAVGRARWIHAAEARLGIAWEHTADRFFAAHDALGLLASYWYCTAHYVVTAAALLWLYSRGAAVYRPARRALGVATLVGLLCYLALPTAPPRLLGGYVDVLGLHAGAGWWGTDASAPRGLGQLTNQLAAFPSLHAGWSLWVALAVTLATGSRVLRAVAWSQAAVTAIVVVGTANHWTLDVLVGWGVTGVVWALCLPAPGSATASSSSPGDLVIAEDPMCHQTTDRPPPTLASERTKHLSHTGPELGGKLHSHHLNHDVVSSPHTVKRVPILLACSEYDDGRGSAGALLLPGGNLPTTK